MGWGGWKGTVPKAVGETQQKKTAFEIQDPSTLSEEKAMVTMTQDAVSCWGADYLLERN